MEPPYFAKGSQYNLQLLQGQTDHRGLSKYLNAEAAFLGDDVRQPPQRFAKTILRSFDRYRCVSITATTESKHGTRGRHTAQEIGYSLSGWTIQDTSHSSEPISFQVACVDKMNRSWLIPGDHVFGLAYQLFVRISSSTSFESPSLRKPSRSMPSIPLFQRNGTGFSAAAWLQSLLANSLRARSPWICTVDAELGPIA